MDGLRVIYAAADMDASAPVIILAGENAERAAALTAAVQKQKRRCALAVAPVADWNQQLSPWAAPAVFRGSEDFGGGADAFLADMLAQLPRVLAETGAGRAYIMGYSLAGLFALYAATKTDAFERVAALSPSVWFEGFAGYLNGHPPVNAAARYYLSLGRKEEKAGNAVLRTVGENLRRVQTMLSEQTGAEVPLVLHDGGHYTEVDRRKLAALEWMLR